MAYTPLNVSAPAAFSYTPGQTQFTEELSHELLSLLSTLSANDAQVAYTSLAESTALDTDLSTYIASVGTWLETIDAEIEAAQALGEEPTLTGVPALPVNPGEPTWIVVVKFVLKVAVEIFLAWLRNRKKNRENVDVKEFIEYFRAAFLWEYTDGQGTDHMLSVLNRIANENEMAISFNDGAIKIYPKAMSIDLDDALLPPGS
jgi:hypothetical protein